MSNICYLCENQKLNPLPSLSEKSLTTDGKTLNVRTSIIQCENCGLVQKFSCSDEAEKSSRYESEYDMYSRPNMQAFDATRYQVYADWISRHFPQKPSRILEVGCGRGWLMSLLRQAFPQHIFVGLEPSREACESACANGLDVRQGSLGDMRVFDANSFDVVFSVNVLEHTVNPIKFLSAMVEILQEDGEVLTICPNGDVLSSELLYSDHLFSLGRHNLVKIYGKAGLCATSWETGPSFGMHDLHFLRGRVGSSSCSWFGVDDTINQSRYRYMKQWQSLDAALCERLKGSDQVFCFGAGETSDLLAFLAPEAWSRVKGYVVDDIGSGMQTEYRGLPLRTLGELADDVPLLIGVKQHYQPKLCDRLMKRFSLLVRWDDLVVDGIP